MTLFLSSERLKNDLLNDNVADEYIRSATIIAQRDLRELLGDCLYEALENKVESDELDGTVYQELLDGFIVPWLEFRAMGELCVLTSFKVGNIGVFSNYDQNANQNELGTVKYIQNYWAQKAEYYRNRLVKFLDRNADEVPEWKDCCNCGVITSPSHNNITRTGIWLGGK